MSFHRRMTRPDANQQSIVNGLRKAGIAVWIIGEPCDLLAYNASTKRWTPLEVKPVIENKSNTKKQVRQKEFIATYAVPVVKTFLEALAVVTLRP
jgi:hypothetical protein